MIITIIGAGKTGRGFIARLLKEEKYHFSFIDSNSSLVERLESSEYSVSFFGDGRDSITIDGYEVFIAHSLQSTEALCNSDVIFISVGVNNFPDIALQLATATANRKKKHPIFTVLCENAVEPGKKFLKLFCEAGGSDKQIHLAESAIFCTTIEDQVNSINILSEDYSILPTNVSPTFKANKFNFMLPTPNFDLLLKRKIYTYNSASALIAYLGWYKGFAMCSEAANDEIISSLLDDSCAAIDEAIVNLFQVSKDEQAQFSSMAKQKFKNVFIEDTIERNAREASRKLGYDERIIGPMKLLLQINLFSIPLALTAAMALKYGIEHENCMKNDFLEGGLKKVLTKYSLLSEDSLLYDLIEEYFEKVMNGHSIEKILHDSTTPNILIFGAGKIARGFIGHLLWRGQRKFKFIDQNKELVEEINKAGSYQVRILRKEICTDIVTGASALFYNDKEKIKNAIACDVNTIFISIGGKNLLGIKDLLKDSLIRRMTQGNKRPINIILCENWKNPADLLKNSLIEDSEERLKNYIDDFVGISEAVIMRSGIEPPENILKDYPLAINVQDYWNFPVDATRLKQRLPAFPGLQYLENFNGFLEEKFYTYNAANGCVSYLGYLKGYRFIHEAAKDPFIVEVLENVYKETSYALCKKHKLDTKEHFEFTRTSLRKLQDEFTIDYVERHARDPIRKLGPTDRLIGPAVLVLEYGEVPEMICVAIAAAIYYDEPSDPIAQELVILRKEKGVSYILDNICKIADQKTLKNLIFEKISFLKEIGLIKDN